MTDEELKFTYEYTLVIDGDPRMDGTHERREVGRFKTLSEARRGYQVLTGSGRALADDLRIERRAVGPWEFVRPWDDVDDGGLPVHLYIGVTAAGQGPTGDSSADHFICWCRYAAECQINPLLRRGDAGWPSS